MEFGQLTDVEIGNIFKKNFACFENQVLNPGPILFHQLTATKQEPIMMSLWFFGFLKMSTETRKNSKYLAICYYHVKYAF